jgi:hypothetical protein
MKNPAHQRGVFKFYFSKDQFTTNFPLLTHFPLLETVKVYMPLL